MVLESLVGPLKAEKKPWELFFIGALYAAVGVLLSVWIFEEYASLVMVFLTTTAAVPLFYYTMLVEEQKGAELETERAILHEHWRALRFFMLLFVGMVSAFTLMYVVLPSSLSNTVFSIQTQTIAALNQQVTGNAAQVNLLSRIFLNNIKVMIFVLLFSFLYGAGAIFILTWNASVISAALGNFIRVHISLYANAVGLEKVFSYFWVVSLSMVRYFIHGLPEILGYFIAGLAGGIISAALVRHDFGTKQFERVIVDVSDLVLLAVIVLFGAALVEVYVTPAFF
ncbi:stage II sporulation protein M [Candidatus Woesearchaeota archaeon]|nr:stage II sporulation protein M [Candidatus Woesearchaeota archaeon]